MRANAMSKSTISETMIIDKSTDNAYSKMRDVKNNPFTKKIRGKNILEAKNIDLFAMSSLD